MHTLELSLPVTNPVLVFAIALLLILIVPLIFQRLLRLPGLIGLIIAGVLIGPHGLNILARDASIELLGTVGLLYIMFISGLEIDLNEFKRQRHRSLLFGTLTFVIPQGLGILVGIALLHFSWPSAVLLGAVISSHTLLAYPLVSRLGLGRVESVTVAVGATILTDTAALLVLALVVQAANGQLSPLFWLQIGGALTLYVLGVLWAVPRLGQWFFQKIRSEGTYEFVFVLTILFVCAFFAAVAGVEPIVGAFLAGLTLNRLVPEPSPLMHQIRFVGESLFIPFFLLSVGMLVDVRVFFQGAQAWTVTLVMLGAVLLAKWSAAQLTRPLFGYSADHGWLVFGLTIPQAAATLATVLVGYQAKLFDINVLNGTILMMLITCVLGPWVAGHYGRRIARAMEHTPLEASHAPQRIMVPLANPETAPLLMELALLIRQPAFKQPLYPITVVRNRGDVNRAVVEAEKLLGHATAHAVAANVPVTPLVRIGHNVVAALQQAIQEQRISTVVIGWNGKIGRRHIFESVLDQLLERSQELVLVSKIELPLATINRVVLLIPPYAEAEPGFTEAIRTLKTLTRQEGAQLVVFTPKERLSQIQTLLKTQKPTVPTTYHPLSSWSQIIVAYQAESQPHDLLCLISARSGTLSWHPSLERLPRLLARRFPQKSLLVVFPPLFTEEQKDLLLSTDSLSTLLTPQRIRLPLQGEQPAEALADLLQTGFSETDFRMETLIPLLLEKGVVALTEDVALYHAHVDTLTAPMLFLGIHAQGLQFSQHAHPVHLVMVLLSPNAEPSENHVHRIEQLVRLAYTPSTIAQLRKARTPEEAYAVLHTYLHTLRS